MSATLMPLAFMKSGPAVAQVAVQRDVDTAVAFAPFGHAGTREVYTPVILYTIAVGLPFTAECSEWYADADRLRLSLDRGDEDTCEDIAVSLPDWAPGLTEIACTHDRGDVIRFDVAVYPD